MAGGRGDACCGPSARTVSLDGGAESRAEINRFNLEVQIKFQTISEWKG